MADRQADKNNADKFDDEATTTSLDESLAQALQVETSPEEGSFRSFIADFKKTYREAGGVKAWLQKMLKDEKTKSEFLNALKTTYPGKS
eukprot:10019427-Karenia_brevis.AAC.1